MDTYVSEDCCKFSSR